MAKYGNSYYLELTRKLWEKPYSDLSINAKWLYCTLKELEQRYCGTSERNYFIRSNEELCKDSGIGITTLKKAKAELAKSKLVIMGTAHWKLENGKLSEKRITTYTII